MSTVQWRLPILGLLSILCIWIWFGGLGSMYNVNSWLAGVFGASVNSAVLTVAFLDVGQGDAIYIETPDGVQMLIDGGATTAVLRTLTPVMPWLDRSLDVVLATHYDLDHIGGLVDVLNRFEVSTIIQTKNEHDTSVTEAFARAVSAEQATVQFVEAGQVLTLGASTTFTILSPTGDSTQWESNNASIVGKLSYGEIDFLLTGDAGAGIEEYLVRVYGTTLQSEVLKFGHHGSKTSSSEVFIEAVQPAIAVVSAGKDNRYGHPHPDVVARAEAVGAQVVSTAEEGTIVFQSDGKTVWVK